jgi:glycosyltransferase involved in cell wall biosynthesis
MTKEPFVSVITPFYNTAKYLSECIESVLAQTYQNFEYLLVNNRSTDASRDIAARYAAKDSRIRLIDNPVFVAQVENYNGALAQIAPLSKYVKLVQADDTIVSRCISCMVELAEREPEIGLVSSYRRTGNQQAGGGIPEGVSRVPGREACRRMLTDSVYFLGSPTTVLYRADIVRSRKPFYTLGRYHEDTEAGYEILLAHDLGFVHEILSFTRVDNASVMTSTRVFNSQDLDYLIVLERFGSCVLTPEELARRRAETHRGYYRFLGRALLRCQSRAFWKYHRIGLATIGHTLRWRQVIVEAGLELIRLLSHPRRTVKQVIADVQKRFRMPKAPVG